MAADMLMLTLFFCFIPSSLCFDDLFIYLFIVKCFGKLDNEEVISKSSAVLGISTQSLIKFPNCPTPKAEVNCREEGLCLPVKHNHYALCWMEY